MQAALARETCEHWLEALDRARVPAAPVNELSHAFADPQALARHMNVSVPLAGGGHVDEPGNPVKLSETSADVFTAPPLVGQHTQSVLQKFLGIGEEKLYALSEQGVIGLLP